VALVSVIRRWHLREGMPIREIARRTGLSRNTVRKYLARSEAGAAYPARKSPSKLDDYEETLNQLAVPREPPTPQAAPYGPAAVSGPAWSWVTPAPMIGLPPSPVVARGAAGRQAGGREARLCRCSLPGEAFQFDWSEDWVKINGVSTKLQIAHFKLSYSRAPTSCGPI
jgi:hypothetical protein